MFNIDFGVCKIENYMLFVEEKNDETEFVSLIEVKANIRFCYSTDKSKRDNSLAGGKKYVQLTPMTPIYRN